MEKKKLVPEIRFKGYNGEWEEHSLGELGPVRMCKRILKAQTSKKGEVPFYKIGTFGKEPDAYISKDLFEEYKKLYSFPKKGDIIVSAAGTIGRTEVYDGKPSYFQDSNLIWIENDNKIIDNSFLAIAYSIINWATSSTTIARIYNETVRQTYTISPNSIDEQKYIGEYFKKLDGLITETEKEIERLDRLKTASLQKMFPQPGENTPQIRFNNFTEPWKEIELKNICNYQSSSLSISDAKLKGKFPLFDANNQIGYTDDIAISFEYISIIKDGAGVGRCRILPKHSFIIGTLGALLPKADINLWFLYLTLQNMKLENSFTGSTIPHIYFKDYGSEKVLVPSLDEQQTIGEYFRNLDNIISEKKKKVGQLRNLKKACLSKMFVNTIKQ